MTLRSVYGQEQGLRPMPYKPKHLNIWYILPVYTMMDLLENIDVLCKKCKVPMERGISSKEGFKLRVFQCPNCKARYFHPSDFEKFEEFQKIKGKQFNMKLRMVGNSFTISIPKEIVRFTHVKEDSIIALSMENPDNVRIILRKQVVHKEEYSDEN